MMESGKVRFGRRPPLDDEIAHSLEFVAGDRSGMSRYGAEPKSRAELGESFIPEDCRLIHQRLTWITGRRDHNDLRGFHPPCAELRRRDSGKRQSKRDYDDSCTR
jgi:hypothetical protein